MNRWTCIKCLCLIQLQGLSNRNGKILHVTKLIHVKAYTILRNETKRKETKRNETKSGEIEQN